MRASRKEQEERVLIAHATVPFESFVRFLGLALDQSSVPTSIPSFSLVLPPHLRYLHSPADITTDPVSSNVATVDGREEELVDETSGTERNLEQG
jgi:hypothetical protein